MKKEVVSPKRLRSTFFRDVLYQQNQDKENRNVPGAGPHHGRYGRCPNWHKSRNSTGFMGRQGWAEQLAKANSRYK